MILVRLLPIVTKPGFIGHVAIATLSVLLGTAFAFGNIDSPWLLAWSSWPWLIWLAIVSLVYRHIGVPRFDMLVASETIIAFGIFVLVMGMVVGVSNLAAISHNLQDIRLADFGPVTKPFLEGLISAAVAPVIAVGLRQYEVLSFGATATDAGVDPAISSADLAEKLKNLGKIIETTQQAVESFTKAFEAGATAYTKSLQEIANSTKKLGPEIAREVGRLGGTFEEMHEKIKSFQSQLKETGQTGQVAMNELSAGANALRESLRKCGEVLDGFIRLVASIERFVQPRKK